MIEANTVAQLRTEVAKLRGQGKRIAFVPTMGNLHAGHQHLMEEARKYAEAVVASVYVNPLQFSPQEDFASYPRTLAADRALLERVAVDLLFVPDERDIYPRGPDRQTQVEVPQLGDTLCGAFRPGHFRGVTTVVARLFHLVTPDVALFGKKDYQQLMLIHLMVTDLGMPVEVIGIDTVRETDGLALSSRNNYLSADERRRAPVLYKVLAGVREGMRIGASRDVAEQGALTALRAAGLRPDYVSVRRASDLAEPGPADKRLIVLAAAWLGNTRLIDNLEYHIP